MRAGAVACVRHVRNPVELARRVMEKSRHVLLVGPGAEEFALEEGFTLVPNHYFRTAERLEQLEHEQRGERVSDLAPPTSPGHRRARWRCDAAGNLAAATSTGGMTNKRPGRVGDSPDHRRGHLRQERCVRGLSHRPRGVLHPRRGRPSRVRGGRVPRTDARAGGTRAPARSAAGARRRRRPDRGRSRTVRSSWISAPRACSAARATPDGRREIAIY